MSRLLIVANRLPVTVRATEGGVEVQRSAGGLATGLMRPHEQSDGLWIGWSGRRATSTPRNRRALDRELAAMRLVGVPLSADSVGRFYEGFSNGVLWPLFHYLLDQIPLQVSRLGRLRRGERGVRRRGRGALPAGRHDLGARLPAPPPARAPARAAARARASASSSTSRSPPRSCSGRCPGATGCSRACSAPTSSASTRRPTSATSPSSLTDILGLLGRDRPGAAP